MDKGKLKKHAYSVYFSDQDTLNKTTKVLHLQKIDDVPFTYKTTIIYCIN